LGNLVPATAPTIVASGNAFELQLGPATFWWENPAGQTAYSQIRVGFGSSGPTPDCTSSPPTSCVTLADLQAPAAPTNVSGGPQVTATSSSGVATPVDSGVDQAPLSVQVLSLNPDGSQGPPLETSDPSYARIYYREDLSQALITNLFGADVDNFIGVSPYAGVYSNNGDADSGPVGVFNGFHYVATMSTIDQHIIGYLALGAGPPGSSDPIEVHGSGIDPQNNTTSAAGGVSLAGCQDFTGLSTCALAQIDIDPTTLAGTPAMYVDTTNGLQIGVLTAAQVTTAVASLPLAHAPGTAEHLLATASLAMSEAAATLNDTSAFQSGDTVDTNLVTHGMLAPPLPNIAVS
jgi:hypothetical protein